MTGHILWNDRDVPYEQGETLAQALNRAGITHLGTGLAGQSRSVFCGIGQCQNCLVILEGKGPCEACRVLCCDGLAVSPVGTPHD